MKKRNFYNINYSLYELNNKLEIIKIDKEFTNITGYTNKDISENKLSQKDLIFEEDQEEYFKYINKELLNKNELFLEHRIKTKNNKEIYVFCLGEVSYNNNEKIIKVRIIDLDKSTCVKKREYEIEKKYSMKIKELLNQATIDNLTGLLRRESYEYKVNNYISNKVDFTFAMIDIDDFKKINDLYGHDIGDNVLKKVSKIILNEVGEFGCAGRMGGDEFSVSLLFLEQEKVNEILYNIYKRVKNIRIKGIKKLSVSLSMGVTFVDSKKITDFNSVYVNADQLLYISKEKGKNQITCVK